MRVIWEFDERRDRCGKERQANFPKKNATMENRRFEKNITWIPYFLVLLRTTFTVQIVQANKHLKKNQLPTSILYGITAARSTLQIEIYSEFFWENHIRNWYYNPYGVRVSHSAHCTLHIERCSILMAHLLLYTIT